MSAPIHDRRRSLFVPVILIAVGIGALGDQLGWFTFDLGQLLVSFWPLLLIALGLSLILGGRRPWIGGVLALLVIGTIGVSYVTGFGLDAPELTPTSANLPRATIKSAKLKLDCDASETVINALAAEDPLLFDATLFASRATLDANDDVDDGVADVRLRADQDGWLGFGGATRRWELGLSRELPLDLTFDCSGFDFTADLSDLQVKSLALDLNAGTATLTLPDSGATKVTIDANASSIDLTIPDGVEAQIKGDFNVTDLELDERFFKGGSDEYHTANWDPAKGGLEVTIDASAASLTVR